MNNKNKNEDPKKRDDLFFTDSDKQRSVVLPDDTGHEGGKPRPDGKSAHGQEEDEEEDVK